MQQKRRFFRISKPSDAVPLKDIKKGETFTCDEFGKQVFVATSNPYQENGLWTIMVMVED